MRDYLHDYRNGPLKDDLEFVYLVICPDLDNFHEGNTKLGKGPVVTYMIFGKGVIIDDPELEDIANVRAVYNYPELKFIFTPCAFCRKKGALGAHCFENPYE